MCQQVGIRHKTGVSICTFALVKCPQVSAFVQITIATSKLRTLEIFSCLTFSVFSTFVLVASIGTLVPSLLPPVRCSHWRSSSASSWSHSANRSERELLRLQHDVAFFQKSTNCVLVWTATPHHRLRGLQHLWLIRYCVSSKLGREGSEVHQLLHQRPSHPSCFMRTRIQQHENTYTAP